MNISISDRNTLYTYLSEIGYYGLDVSFDSFAKREYILSDEYTDFIVQKFKKITDASLKVCQTHLTYYPGHIKPIGNGTYEEFEKYMLPMFIKEIELTKLLNCRVCVFHPYFESDKTLTRKGNISLISKLLPYAEKFEVTLAIENIYGNKYSDAHISTPEDFMYYMDCFKNPFLGICLDTGHALVLNQNPLELFKKLKNYIAALHLHTTINNIDLHQIPYLTSGAEQIDWAELYKEINASDYQGTFNLELRPPVKLNEDSKKAYYLLAYKIAKGIMEE